MYVISPFYMCLSLAVMLLFFGKYFTIRTNRRPGKRYRHRWSYLYGQDDIEGEPSRDYRAYMSGSNIISLCMWAFMLIAGIFLLIYIF